MPTIFKAYATFSECYRRNFTMRQLPQGIVIHSTAANNPRLSRYVLDEQRCGVNPYHNYMGSEASAKAGNYTTPHAVAGLDIKGDIAIAQILPYNICCYGCGQGTLGSYNDTHIQIEICEDGLDDKDYCTNVFRAVAEWCVDVMRKYPYFEVDDIVSHKEAHALGYASNHGDPEHWLSRFGYTMDDFRKWVTEAQTPKTIYRIQVGAFNDEQLAKQFLSNVQILYPHAYIVMSQSD